MLKIAFEKKSWNHNKQTEVISFPLCHSEPGYKFLPDDLFTKLYPFTGHFEKHQPQLCPLHHSQSREEGR